MTRNRHPLSRSCAAVIAGLVLCVALAAGCGGRPPSPESAQARELLGNTASTYAELRSFSERTVIQQRSTYSGKTTTSRIETEFDYRYPNLIRYENRGARTSLWASDGKRMIYYSPDTKTYREAPAPASLEQFLRLVRFDSPGLSEVALLVGRPWESVLTDLKLGEPERIEGVATRPVSGSIAALVRGEEAGEARQTLWIDTKTLLIRRNRVVRRVGDETTQWTETMEEVQADPDLPDDRFHWTPPPGAKPAGVGPQPSPPPRG